MNLLHHYAGIPTGLYFLLLSQDKEVNIISMSNGWTIGNYGSGKWATYLRMPFGLLSGMMVTLTFGIVRIFSCMSKRMRYPSLNSAFKWPRYIRHCGRRRSRPWLESRTKQTGLIKVMPG